MKHIPSLVLAAALGSASLLQAQDAAAPAATDSSSLLGKRYLGASFGYQDIENRNLGAFGGGLDINLPVAANVDVGFGVSHGWLEGDNSFHQEGFDVYATYYVERGAFRPFVTGSLGHTEVSFPGPFEDDFGSFGVSAGSEYLINSTVSVAGFVSYNDTFESGDQSVWSGTLQLNYWLRSDLAVGGSVSVIEYGNVSYGLGANWVF